MVPDSTRIDAFILFKPFIRYNFLPGKYGEVFKSISLIDFSMKIDWKIFSLKRCYRNIFSGIKQILQKQTIIMTFPILNQLDALNWCSSKKIKYMYFLQFLLNQNYYCVWFEKKTNMFNNPRMECSTMNWWPPMAINRQLSSFFFDNCLLNDYVFIYVWKPNLYIYV